MGRVKGDGRPGQKKVKDPNRPKRATSAYFYFLASCRENAKKQGKSISKIAEFTKECSVTWRALSEHSKKIFDDKAAADKQRYEREIANYTGASHKPPKDPNQPKKPLTGYFIFLADFRKQQAGNDVPNKELLKMAGERWREMNDRDKLPYEQKSQEGQKHYEVAMAQYRRNCAAGASASANGGANSAEEEYDDEEDDDEEDDE